MIAWGRLKHAYGSAEDLPPLVAAIGHRDPSVAAEALHALAHRVHQSGAIFEATAYVVPSLVALAMSPRCALRVRVLRVLGMLAGRAADQADIEAALFSAEPALVALLSDDDASVRAAAAAVLARLPAIATETRAALLAHQDTDARVRFGLALTLAAADGPWIETLASTVTAPPEWLAVSGEDARTAALQALARTLPERAPAVVRALLPVFDALVDETRLMRDVMVVLVRAMGPHTEGEVLGRIAVVQALWRDGEVDAELRGVLRARGLPTERAAIARRVTAGSARPGSS